MVKKLFSLLKDGGVDVFLPMKHTGKCTSPYAVVSEEDTNQGKTGSGVYTYFTVTLISPAEDYASLDSMDKKVRTILKDKPFKFVSAHTESADPETAAYKRTLYFRVLKKSL